MINILQCAGPHNVKSIKIICHIVVKNILELFRPGLPVAREVTLSKVLSLPGPLFSLQYNGNIDLPSPL